MRRSRGRILAAAWTAAGVASAVFAAGGPIAREAFSRPKADRSSTSIGVSISAEELEKLPANRRSFDEVVFSVPGVQRSEVSAGHLPRDWRFDAGSQSANGPAISGGDFRLDVPLGWTPRKKLEIELRWDGRSIWKEKLDVEERDPVMVSGDLAEFIDLPRTVHGGSAISLPDGNRNKWSTDLRWNATLQGMFRLPAGVSVDGRWTPDDTKVFSSSHFLTGMASYVGDGWRPFGLEDGQPVPGPRTDAAWDELGKDGIGIFRTVPETGSTARRGEGDSAFGGLSWSVRDEDVAGGFGLGTVDWWHEEVRFELPGRSRADVRWGAPRAVWRIRGTDRFGETLVDGHWTPVVLPPTWPDRPAEFTGVTEVVAPHEAFCVTGRVGSLDQWNGLQIGGADLGAPIFATNSSAVFLPPSDLDPGVHRVTYLPWAGTDPDTGLSTAYITVSARIEKQRIRTGGETRLTLGIVGTDRSFPVKLVNKSPSIINLEGKIEHHDLTTGGADNRIEKTILGLTPGDYDIYYEVELPTCPGEAKEAASADAGDALVQALAGWSESLGGTPAPLDPQAYATPTPEPRDPAFTLQGRERRNRLWYLQRLSEEAARSKPQCASGVDDLALDDGRFRVEVGFGDLRPRERGACFDASTGDTGLFYYFDRENWEMLVKVVDGCSFNDRYWVFAAGTTGVEYELTVTDTQTGSIRTYAGPLGRAAPAITDTDAFATCP